MLLSTHGTTDRKTGQSENIISTKFKCCIILGGVYQKWRQNDTVCKGALESGAPSASLLSRHLEALWAVPPFASCSATVHCFVVVV